MGTEGVAIGVSGFPALLDLRGKPDLFDRTLEVTQVGLADELAAADFAGDGAIRRTAARGSCTWISLSAHERDPFKKS